MGLQLADLRTGLKTLRQWQAHDANGGVIAHINNVVSVDALGAVGDGETSDTAVIQAAIDAANAAGGGIVIFGPKTYYLATALVPKSGVTLQGVRWTWNESAVSAGTLLLGNATNDCIAYNTVDLGAQLANGVVQAHAVHNFNVYDIAFQNFAVAIHGGALYDSGFFDCEFRDLLFYDINTWGIYAENCSRSTWDRLYFMSQKSGAAGNACFATSATNFTHGNSRWSYLWGNQMLPLSRGLVWLARAGSAQNQQEVYHIQQNGGGGPGGVAYSSANVTLSNGSANVILQSGEGAKFKVDQPVAFTTAPGSGTDAYEQLFVLTVVGDVLTLARSQRGAAVTVWSSNTNYTLKNLGFPPIEVVGYSRDNDPHQGAGDGAFQSITIHGVDVEGIAGSGVFLQNAHVNLHIATTTTSNMSPGVVYFSVLCARGNTMGQWDAQYQVTADIESGSNPFYTFGTYIVSYVNASPKGIYYNAAVGAEVINIGNSLVDAASTFQLQTVGGKHFTYPTTAIGKKQYWSSSGSLALDASMCGTMSFDGGAGATWTLPALAGTMGGAASGNTAGMIFTIVNNSSGNNALTLATSSSQDFGRLGSAKTSYSIPWAGSITVEGIYDSTPGVYWAVTANNGAT